MAAAPKANASRAQWVRFFAEEYPDVDTDDMGRPDLISVHKLRKGGSPADDDEQAKAANVPDSLQFSTVADEDEVVELAEVEISLDGNKVKLRQLPDAAMTFWLNQMMSDDPTVRTNAMTMYVQQSLDLAGMKYLQSRLMDRSNDYRPGIYGEIVAASVELWGDEVGQRAVDQARKADEMNRKERRAAARAAARGK